MEVSIGITIGKFRDNSDHNPIKTHEWHYFYYHYLSIYSNITGKPLLLPVPTSTIRTSKKNCVLWDKMHMSRIVAFILQPTA